MNYMVVDKTVESRKDIGGAWIGQGLFRAMGNLYLKTEDGCVFDMGGVQVFLPNEAIVYPMKVVGGST